jgi:hypothetical protein
LTRLPIPEAGFFVKLLIPSHRINEMNKPKHILLVENHAGFLRTIRKFLTATVFLEKGVSMAIIARCFYIVFIIFILSAVAIPIDAAE